ncbi:MAG: Ig-like domain-containing protein [Brevinematales bacterium]|nr:Ig-like domain-containing protein [Brevinematales bacterium]
MRKRWWWIVSFFFFSCTAMEEERLILSPRNGETVRGVVIISVSPPATMVVDRVEISINGKRHAVIPSPGPYSSQWDTTSSPNGFYTLSVSVYDIEGKVQSETIEVQVAN